MNIKYSKLLEKASWKDELLNEIYVFQETWKLSERVKLLIEEVSGYYIWSDAQIITWKT